MKWQVKGLKTEEQAEVESEDETLPATAAAESLIEENPAHIERWLTLKSTIHRKLLDRINLSMLDKLSREQIDEEAGGIILELLAEENAALNAQERTRLVDEVLDELLGLGPLEPLLEDETTTDILVNGYKTVFVERFGLLEKVPVRFQDERHLMRIIQRIVSAVGRRIDESSPFVDARLADG